MRCSSRLENALNLAHDRFDLRNVVKHSEGVDAVEVVVREGEAGSVCLVQVHLQSACDEIAGGQLKMVVRDIDTVAFRPSLAKPGEVSSLTDSNFEDAFAGE